MDDKGRLFGKVSIIDAFIVLLVLAIGVAVVLGRNVRENPPDIPERDVIITFFHPQWHTFTVDALASGARVITDVEEVFLGYVTAYEIGDSVLFVPDGDGNMVPHVREGYRAVMFQTRVTGALYGDSLIIDGHRYRVGNVITLWAGAAKFHLPITDMQPAYASAHPPANTGGVQ